MGFDHYMNLNILAAPKMHGPIQEVRGAADHRRGLRGVDTKALLGLRRE